MKKDFLMQQRLAKKKARKTTNDWGQGFNLLKKKKKKKKKAKDDYVQT